ncbi:MAG: hypothetical protein GX235_06340 [Clostridiales bacterium]|nr:hypothetical protein [Clostridiales bacterium]
MKMNLEKKLASKISDVALETVKNTVGKSVPALAHEVEMPECIRKEFLNKEIDA